ncbi:MAG: caspase family protein [Crocinitomicaceae bacterium]|nr:caspase family protein [Crocinitomicaceae bacterium]
MKILFLIITLILTSGSLQAQEPNLVIPLGIPSRDCEMKINQDAKLFLLNYQTGIVIFDSKTGKEIKRLQPNKLFEIIDARWTEDNYILSFEYNSASGQLIKKQYNLDADKKESSLSIDLPPQTQFTKLSPSARLMVLYNDLKKSYSVFDFEKNDVVLTYNDDFRYSKFSKDEKYILFQEYDSENGQYARFYNIYTGKCVYTFHEDSLDIQHMDIHPLSNSLLITTSDAKIHFWDAKRKQTKILNVYDQNKIDSLNIERQKDFALNFWAIFSPEKKCAISFCDSDHFGIKQFSLEDGKLTGNPFRYKDRFSYEKNGKTFPKHWNSVLEDNVWWHYYGLIDIQILSDNYLLLFFDEFSPPKIWSLSEGRFIGSQYIKTKYWENVMTNNLFNDSKENPSLMASYTYDSKSSILYYYDFDNIRAFDLENEALIYQNRLNQPSYMQRYSNEKKNINNCKLISIGLKSNLLFWDPITAQTNFMFPSLKLKDFSPNGNLFVGTKNDSIELREIKTGALISTKYVNDIGDLEFTVDSKKIVFINERSLILADINDSSSFNSLIFDSTYFERFLSRIRMGKNKFIVNDPYANYTEVYSIDPFEKLKSFHPFKEDSINRWTVWPELSDLESFVSIPNENDSSITIFHLESDKKINKFQGLDGLFIKDKYFFTMNFDRNKICIYDFLNGVLIDSMVFKNYISDYEFNEELNQFLISFDNIKKSDICYFDEDLGKVNKQFEIFYRDKRQPRYFKNEYLITYNDYHQSVWRSKDGKKLYTRLQLENGDWLAYDAHYRFDGTPAAIDYLYLTCGTEIIDLSQVKDSLWVPGLVEKIMTDQEILIDDKPAPKLSDLNICGLTPVIEPLEKGKQGEYHYRVIPRRGGLGETEVYINGNLTYSYLPKDLEKNQDGTYLLRLPIDSIQPYLSGGSTSSINPMLVKAKIKGASIYGRGEPIDVPVEMSTEMPRFFGVFVGVNDYGNPNKESSYTRFNDLDYASKDASDLSLAIEASARALFKDSTFIYRLSNDSLQDYTPSKENLTRVFEDIGKKAKANDVLFVFFAGHGAIDEKGDKKEIKFMLEKADKRNKASTGFGVADLSNWCHPKKVKAQKRVFVFDACHSGQFVNEQMAMAQGGRGGDEESARIRQLDKLKDKNGMMILAAAADDQSAYEDVTLDQGVLTYHLLNSMKSGDTTLTVNKWFSHTISLVEEYASRNGHNQSPNSFGSGRFEIGNITKDVRGQIDIVPPKIRIGNCFFMGTGEAEAKYPSLIQSINKELSKMNGRGERLVYSSSSDKTYSAKGTYYFRKKKLMLRYKIYYDNKEIPNLKAVVLGPFKNKSEKEITLAVLESFKNTLSKVSKIKE